MHEELVNLSGGLSLPRKSVVTLTDRPDMTLDVYRGRKTAAQQQQLSIQKLQIFRLATQSQLQKHNWKQWCLLDHVLYLTAHEA